MESKSVLPFPGGPTSKKNVKFQFELNHKILTEGLTFDRAWDETYRDMTPRLVGPFANDVINARFMLRVNRMIYEYHYKHGKDPKGKVLEDIKTAVRDKIISDDLSKTYRQHYDPSYWDRFMSLLR